MISTWNTKSILQSFALFGLVALIVASCGDINTSGVDNNSGKTKMNVHLTDAPGDYQEVNIDVQGLRIHFTPSSSDTVSPDTMKDGKWIDLPVEPMQVNLLELQNGVDTLLASAELDPGTYRELRLILGHDNSVMVDSMIHDLKVPSGQQSGYKIKFKTDLEEGEELDVVIDFDAARSVHKAGNSGKYILKPVLKAFVESSDSGDDVVTGSIAGTIEPAAAAPTISALMDDDTAATTQPDTTGGFLLQGLDPGSYNLVIEPTDEQYADTTLTDILVEEDKETDVGTITLSEDSE